MIIAICDDEQRECERIKEYVLAYSTTKKLDVQIHIYTPKELENHIFQIEKIYKEDDKHFGADFDGMPDIVIMDIEFTDVDFDGIALAKKINAISRNTQIIYLTHILEFAPEVYDTEHCYFVMKRNMDVMLSRALDKARAIYDSIKRRRPLEIMSEGHKIYISQDDICYIEKRQRQTIVHTISSEYSCYDSITALVKKLPENVIRCHGGYLVNLSHVTYLGGEKITLDVSEIDIPIGKTYKEQTKQAYLKYWMKRM